MTIDQKKMARALNDDAAPKCEDIRNSLSAAALKQAVLDHLIYSVGRMLEITPEKSYYKALALIVRDRLQHRWINTTQTYLANAHM
jgi:glycogen phosphorylase